METYINNHKRRIRPLRYYPMDACLDANVDFGALAVASRAAFGARRGHNLTSAIKNIGMLLSRLDLILTSVL